MDDRLPIDEVLPAVRAALERFPSVVLTASPGAGKTTRIPLAIRDDSWVRGNRIVMLEPRRLAARMAAERMARTLGERVGATVGYRVRLDARVSAETKIEVVTEGIFTRRIQEDPGLDGVAMVIFDEFHERSLDADLGLALALETQQALRPDLKILVMSATIDARAIAQLLGPDVPVIESAHRPFPVETRYIPRAPQVWIEDAMARAIAEALHAEEGSVLAFLPGEREIRRTLTLLEGMSLGRDVDVVPLFGALGWDQQQRAVEPPPPGRRKVVLATTIAETSLTIEGVRIVVDSGVKRAPRFDPRRGMSELATVRVSRAAAEQRRGRAGRLGPGVCYRLWAEAEDRGLAAFDAPEIVNADLAPLALDLAAWGVANPETMRWMTPPPPAAFAQAIALLTDLGAIDRDRRITPAGKAMARLPLHPRLAHMVRSGIALNAGAMACDLAALLSERDVVAGARDTDIRTRLQILRGETRDGSRGAVARVRDAARQIRSLAGVKDGGGSTENAGRLIAAAYPDRVAEARGAGKFRLSGGGSARLDPADALAGSDFLAVADLDGATADARIFLAAPVTAADLEDEFKDTIVDESEVAWDDETETVVARRVRRLGALILEQAPLKDVDRDRIKPAMLKGLRRMGLAVLPWDDGLARLRARVAFARGADPQGGWPDFGDDALSQTLDDWLGPFLDGVSRKSHLSRLDLRAALMTLLPWPLPKKLDEIAPDRVGVPSGSTIEVDYAATGGPAIFVKLQEVFGLVDTPRVGGVPVTLHLLSPAQRPIAVTRDLASFWRNVYPTVRGEMRGRYPRHIWPEDPLTAVATRRSIKPRG